MLLSRHQITGQDLNIKTTNRSFENIAKFKYWPTTATHRNFLEEIKEH
jgi:hypothetical protein